jgi:polysaccharide biosynthesis/export protein
LKSVVWAVVSCAVSFYLSATVAEAGQAPAPSPSPSPASQPAAPEETSPYYVAPGDILRVAVWKEPELTTDVFVRLDGRITVPLVGDVKAAGRTTEELTNEIRTRLRAFLEVPQVTITVSQAVSTRFYVIGQVTTSGAFALNSRITVAQALALAGGFREFAKRDRVMLLRESRGERKAIPFNFRDLELGINLDQNIVLESGDTIIVP